MTPQYCPDYYAAAQPDMMDDTSDWAMRQQCKHAGKCGGEMAPGLAIVQTWSGTPDFAGGEVVTVSPGGPGRLVGCMKCKTCGYSVTGEPA